MAEAKQLGYLFGYLASDPRSQYAFDLNTVALAGDAVCQGA
jgi:hypothetical protein